MRVAFGLAATVAIACSSGCSWYKPPTMQAAGARVIDIAANLPSEAQVAEGSSAGGSGVAIEVMLDVTNPNDEGLPLRTVDYTVEIDGKEVYSGMRSAEATASRDSTQRVRLPASFVPSRVGVDPVGIKEYRVIGTMTYVTPGAFAQALFDSGARVPSVSFTTTGEIDFSAFAGKTAAY